MPKLEPVIPVENEHTKLIIVEPPQRKSWAYILNFAIKPLCTHYGLILEHGNDPESESCAIFYADG